MPFTLSHPAIVLPLNLLPARWVSITGLVIGSLAPDLQSYFTPGADKTHSHTWWGILWFCIPVSILLSFVFHLIVREMLIMHLPRVVQIKMIRYKDVNWPALFREKWPVIIISMAVGAASHLFWDSFSHFDGFFIRDNPALQGNMDVLGRSVEIPFVIQYVNSLVGLVIIAIAILQVPRSRNVRIRVVILKYWVIIALLTVIFAFPGAASTDRFKLDDFITSLISAFCTALLITSLLFRQGYVKDAWKPKAKKP